MNMESGWVESRKTVLAIIAEEFSGRCSIGRDEFIFLYAGEECRMPMKRLISQYIPDDNTLDEILHAVASRTGLDRSKVESLFDREETVPQFAERLLRAGAMKDRRKRGGA